MDSSKLLQLTTNIVAAFAGHNQVRADLLPSLISTVYQTLSNVETAPEPEEPREPAVPVRASIKQDHLVCLECGAKFASLRRHLKTSHDLTPDQYRDHWGLRSDYPMVAPSYSARRSEMAKRIGLGARRLRAPEPEELPPPAPEPPRAPPRRGKAAAIATAAVVADPVPPPSGRSPSAETVFANFRRDDEVNDVDAPDEASEEAVSAALSPKGGRRKPFAKQPARSMRTPPSRR